MHTMKLLLHSPWYVAVLPAPTPSTTTSTRTMIADSSRPQLKRFSASSCLRSLLRGDQPNCAVEGFSAV